MGTAWEVTPQKVQTAITRIVEAASPSRLIIFGSYVSGKMHRHSDLDILVVMNGEVENPRKESVRIRRALRGISMPLDILVVGEKTLAGVADTPGLVYREVLRNGKVVYESTT